MTKKSTALDERAIESIVKQFRGGEHRLAGQRASEMIYAGTQANKTLFDKITEAAPGIERYIASPGTPVAMVGDQSGNPLATQPENSESATGAANQSSDEAKAEQDAIDEKLAKGRKRRVEKDDAAETGGEDATKLNPDAA